MKQYIYELMTDMRQGPLDKIAKGLLWFLSLGYSLVVLITCSLYKLGILSVYKAPKPVISVGNITFGGTGKTPLVIWISKTLTQQGINTVVLTRGYGVEEGLNDETKMFKEVLPQVSIMVGRDRRSSIEKSLSQQDSELFVADDAFQHWSLYRDLNIVAIDAANPFGNGHLVPRGVLREDVGALKRADIFVLTKTDRVQSTQALHERLSQINSKAMIVESQHVFRNLRNVFTGQTQSLSAFKNQKVVSFCAIADPSSLEHSLQKAGLVISKNFTFTDHHQYNESDLKKVVDYARLENMNILVTTHKDAVKIATLSHVFKDLIVLSLDIDLEITQGQDEFIKRILSLPHR